MDETRSADGFEVVANALLDGPDTPPVLQPRPLSSEERSRLSLAASNKKSRSRREAALAALAADDRLVEMLALQQQQMAPRKLAEDNLTTDSATCAESSNVYEGIPASVGSGLPVQESFTSDQDTAAIDTTNLRDVNDDGLLAVPDSSVTRADDSPIGPAKIPELEPLDDVSSQPELFDITRSPSPIVLAPHPLDPILDTGDIVLQTSDGVSIRAHALLLQTASPYFRRNPSQTRYEIEHSSIALRSLLGYLYPSNGKPHITDVVMLRNVLAAAHSLEISSFVVRDTLNELIRAESHPLRSWALATAFKYPDAQRIAIERYFGTDSAYLDDIPDETRLVDAFQMLHLTAAKERAFRMARTAITLLEWSCVTCSRRTKCSSHSKRSCNTCQNLTSATNVPWLNDYRERVGVLNPFTFEATSEVMFKLSFLLHPPPCGHTSEFDSVVARGARDDLRARLADILSSEMQGLMVTAPTWDL